MKLLAFDLATTTGWAVDRPAGGVDYGTHRLAATGKDMGRYARAAEAFFQDTIKAASHCDAVVYEAPILAARMTPPVLRKLYSLPTILEMVCCKSGLPVYEAHMSKVRSHFIGCVQAPRGIVGKDVRRKWLKEKIIEACHARGWAPEDDNAADALAVLDWAKTVRVQERLQGAGGFQKV